MAVIALIEDDVALRKQICFSLETRFAILEADSYQQTIELLKKNNVDIVILDLGLPPHEDVPDEGLKILSHVLEHYNAKVIILTGQKTESLALEAIKSGAFDYLMKPAGMDKLLFSIERAILFKETEAEMERQGIKKIAIDVPVGKGLQPLRDEAEKLIILKVLKDTNFNVNQSSKILGVKRESLYYFLKKFGLKRENVGP